MLVVIKIKLLELCLLTSVMFLSRNVSKLPLWKTWNTSVGKSPKKEKKTLLNAGVLVKLITVPLHLVMMFMEKLMNVNKLLMAILLVI
jgi:hypothetical protein